VGVKCTWNRGRVANQRLNSQMLVRGVISTMMCTSKFFGRSFQSPGENSDTPDAGDAVDISRAHCRSPCPVGKQRGGSVASIIVGHSFDITSPAANIGWVRSSAWNSALLIYAQNHCNFPGDLDTALQYPVPFLQKMDRSKA